MMWLSLKDTLSQPLAILYIEVYRQLLRSKQRWEYQGSSATYYEDTAQQRRANRN